MSAKRPHRLARRLEHLPLDEVSGTPCNPKLHDLAAIRASIEQFGYVAPALRDERTGRLVVGHGRTEVLRAMQMEGLDPPAGIQVDRDGRWLVPVVCGWASRSDAEAEAYLVADNRNTELGGWNHAELAELLASINEDTPDLLAATGFDEDDLAQLTASLTTPDLTSFTPAPASGPTSPHSPPAAPHHPHASADPSDATSDPSVLEARKIACPYCGGSFVP